MKKWKPMLIIGIMILICMGCGTQKTETVSSSEGTPVDEIREGSTQTENEVAEKNNNYSDLEKEEDNGKIAAFAEKIQAVVADKDIEALADLCIYPLAVDSEVIEDRNAFIELGEDAIFTEERCAVIAAVDVSTLEETMAGVIMGDATPNIIFKLVDGELGITGIN